MAENSQSPLIPIRLSCRYSNGTVVSYAARAIEHHDGVMRILCSESFEPGVQLSALAPFLDGISKCRVVTVSRSAEQPAYFELELKVIKAAKPVPRPVPAPSSPEWKEAVRWAGELAASLEPPDTLRFSEALQRFSPEQRLSVLQIASVALMFLLEKKKFVDRKRLSAGLMQEATR